MTAVSRSLVADTIAAVATATGPAAIGIVRLSGPDAHRIARAIAPSLPPNPEPQRFVRASFFRRDVAIDEGLVLSFVAPRSYTGEDVVELHGHGGMAVREVLGAALDAGARAAEPGEFTQRAFLNGKLDLVQAEAVARLIGAQSERALRLAHATLGGSLSEQLASFQAEVVALQGRIEGLLDFPAESEGAEHGLREALQQLSVRVGALAKSYSRGRRLFERARVVLAGPVNAGKSSLLNALAGEERALVDAEPGTTRDLVECDLECAGMPVRLVDTAGWREAEGVEARGIARGRTAARAADLTLWVVDVAHAEPSPEPDWLPVANQIDRHPDASVPAGFWAVSALTGAGLSALWSEVGRRLGDVGDESALLVIQERQALGLQTAADALQRAAEQSEALELVAEELKWTARALSAVLGQDASQEVMDSVFQQFCIGK